MKKPVSLKGKRCFSEVFTNGRRFRSTGLQCAVVRNCGVTDGGACAKKPADCSFKIGIVIGRRFGNACERNKAKRRVRAMVDHYRQSLSGDWCMAIRIFDEFKGMEYLDGLSSFQNMMSKAGLIRDVR